MSLIDFTTKRNRARESYATRLAQIDFQRGLYGQKFADETLQFNRSWERRREQQPGQWAGRGMLRSGLYQDDLRQTLEDWATQAALRQRENALQMGQFTFAEQDANMALQQALADLDLQEQMQRAQLASELRGLK